ncbi:MAG: translocation/assembly module TamB domain-containing protein, partial [Flavobacteriaceae bacterium]
MYIEDHHGDTLLYIQELRTSINDFKKLQNTDFDLDAVHANGVFFNIKKYKDESAHSLKVVLDKLKRDQSKVAKPIFQANELNLTHAKFSYNDQNQTENPPWIVKDFSLLTNDFNYRDTGFDLILEKLSGQLKSPVERPIHATGVLLYEPGLFVWNDLNLESNESFINGALKLHANGESFKDFRSSGSVEASFEKSQLNLKDLFPNLPFLKENQPVEFKLKASGSTQAVEVDHLYIFNKDLYFNGMGIIENLLDSNQRVWDIAIDSLSAGTEPLWKLKLIDSTLQNRLSNVDRFQLKGSVSTTRESIGFKVASNNDWARLNLTGSMGKGILDPSSQNRKIVFQTEFNQLDIDRFIPQKTDLKVDFSIEVSGELNREKPIELKWNSPNLQLNTTKMKLGGIAFSGRFQNDQLRNTLKIVTPEVELKSDLRFNFENETPIYTLAANVEKLDLNFLGLNLDTNKRLFKGVILSNLEGKTLDDLKGEIKIASGFIENDKKIISLNPISLIKKVDGNQTELIISNTDCISGNALGTFKVAQLRSLFQNALHEVYPFLPPKKTLEGQNLSFRLTIYKKLLDALYPRFSVAENILLNGRINSNKKRSLVTFDAPLLRWNDFQFEKIHFQIDTKNPIYNTFLNIQNVSHKYFKSSDFSMISTKLRDTLYFRSEFLGQKKKEVPFEVNFYHTLEQNGTSHFGFRKSKIPLGIATWTVNPENTNDQKLSYFIADKKTQLSALTAVSGKQKIAISGFHQSKDNFGLKLTADSVQLEELFVFNPTLTMGGLGSVDTEITRSGTRNQFFSNIAIEDLNINQQDLGTLNLNVNGNTQFNTYGIEMELQKESQKLVDARGFVQDLENPKLNLNFDFQQLDLAFLSPLGKNSIKDFKGIINGNVNLWGYINNLKHNGTLRLSDSGFSIPYINVDYQIDQTDIQLNDQNFNFKSVQLTDSAEGTQAVLNGVFFHDNFSNWQTNLTIASDKMLLLNSEQTPESLFYGKGFLDGILRLNGPTKNLQIDVEGGTEEGTTIKIPWAENYGLSDTSFISFIDKNNITRFDQNTTSDKIPEIRGLEMNFDLDVAPNAQIEIVIDQETGSYLNGRGAGNLFMEIDTNGKFNMWGDFISFDGIYNFKNLGLIDKKFAVKPGGTIVWEGDPLNAQMDLEAVYDVPGGANPALLLDNPNFNKKIPTEVLIKLQGNLLKPDDPIFEIDFPNTSGTVASEINYRLADNQRSQLQAISLLSQGIFINEVSVSMQGVTNNLYQKASEVFSDLLGEDDEKLNVGIDYLQGDKSALLDIATEDRLGFTLSTKISDRILLNGKIGVPVGGLEQTLI